jgi:uncharacterized repeat protein (TIGR03803 family)
MQSAQTNSGRKYRLEKFSRQLRFMSIRTSALCAVITMAAISVLLLCPRPAQAETVEQLENVKTESVLYNFTGMPDGQNPSSRLTLNNGNLYGTTFFGGEGACTGADANGNITVVGCGTVFELSPNGSGGWTESILYSFCPSYPSCVDGANPVFSYLLFDSEGNMYGTAYNGGTNGDGVVFELKPAGGGTWTESVLYSFANSPDGANPINGLIMDSKGNLYGSTFAGGSAGGNGTVFEMSPTFGGWTESPLYPVPSNGSGLAINPVNGYIYGTTYGTVYALVPTQAGGYLLKTVYTFSSGTEPISTPAFDTAGNIYGTTAAGGKYNSGVIYKLTQSGNTVSAKVIADFGDEQLSPPEYNHMGQGILYFGAFPPQAPPAVSAVILDSSNNLYVTAPNGGIKNADAGVILKFTDSNGTYTPSAIWNFDGEDGAENGQGLIMDSSGYLYGTTVEGGSSGNGTVFVVNPNASNTTTTLTSSVNPSTPGETVTFTATITSSGGTPANGDIVVFEPLGQAPITNGVATFTVSDLVKSTKVTAVYQGDLNFITSRSNTVDEIVTQ